MSKICSQIKIVIFVSLSFIKVCDTQDFKDFFINCQQDNTKDFDKCIKKALNDMRIFYKSGKNK